MSPYFRCEICTKRDLPFFGCKRDEMKTYGKENEITGCNRE